jgi:hypothetical protein
VTGPGARPAPADPARRVVAEFTGTALLVAAVVGSGIAAARLSPRDTGDWDLPDPAGQPIETVRCVRDEIGRRVGALLAELVRGPVTGG